MVVIVLSGLLGHERRRRSFGQAALALAGLAVGTSFNYALANTTVQERAPGAVARTRVGAGDDLSFVGVMPFSSLLVTELADLTSIRRGDVRVRGRVTRWFRSCLFAGTGPALRK